MFVFVWFVHLFYFACLLDFYISHRSEILWYLSFSIWFISLSLLTSRSIHVVTDGKISSLYGWVADWATSLSLSCIGEGNGNLLQCSCLENPGDGGTWWAAVYGVVQSRTRLKRLSNSSSSLYYVCVYLISLSIHLLMDTWVVSVSWPL